MHKIVLTDANPTVIIRNGVVIAPTVAPSTDRNLPGPRPVRRPRAARPVWVSID